MVQFKTIIHQFNEQGEKTGWTYIEVPADIAQQLKPGFKKSFRVKGKLDNFSINCVALMPMGEGNFILGINAEMRKGIRKAKGATLSVELEFDPTIRTVSDELMMCLEDDPIALERFKKMPNSHQMYFSNWIESAKTIETKSKRIAQTIEAMLLGQNYGEMIRANKKA